MKTSDRPVISTFLTGLVVALPLMATVVVFVWGARLLYSWLGPGSLFGQLLVHIGLGVSGSEMVGYLIGVGILLLGIYALGILVQTRLRGVMAAAFNAVMQRIPLVRGVYDLIKKFVDLVSQRDADGVGSMSPVWLHFGGVGGAAVLGLLSTPAPVMVGGKPYLAVLVPTAPVPVGGGLLYVPQEWVTPAEMGVEGLTSIYVSMGITSHQHLASAKSAGAAELP
jgi:uncharacterized membrane protein